MRSLTACVPLVLCAALLVPGSAQAGLLSALAKLGSAGKATRAVSAGAKAVKVGKVASAAKAAKLGLGAGKAATLGKAAAGVTGAVAAERAGLALATVGDDAARGGLFLARTGEGEVVLASRSGGAVKQASHAVDDLPLALDTHAMRSDLGPIYLDPSAAASPEVVAKLPADAELVLTHEGQHWPVRRVADDDHLKLVMDTADGAVDVADLLSLDSGEGEDAEAHPLGGLAAGLGGMAVLAAWFVYFRKRAPSAST